jgi:replication factor C subunit 1
LQDYCINRDQWDFVLDITKFKSKAPWAAEPTEGLESKVKSAFTRKFNQQVRLCSNTMTTITRSAF